MLHGISANPKKDLPKINFWISNNLVSKHSRPAMHMFENPYCIHIVMKISKLLSHKCVMSSSLLSQKNHILL